MNREDIVKEAMGNPEALWEILTTAKKVAGGWVPAKSESRNVSVPGGFWRLNPEGKDICVVRPSHKLSPPELWEFHTTYNEDNEVEESDWDHYQAAVADYEQEKLEWKPWCGRIGRDREIYTNTKEEAMAEVDKRLIKKGWTILSPVKSLPEDLILALEEGDPIAEAYVERLSGENR